MELFNNHIMLLPDPPRTVTKGGIELPDTAKEKPVSGREVDDQAVIQTDHIFYPSYTGTEILLQIHGNSKTYILIKKEEILFTFSQEEYDDFFQNA